jgi:hypothetical protein
MERAPVGYAGERSLKLRGCSETPGSHDPDQSPPRVVSQSPDNLPKVLATRRPEPITQFGISALTPPRLAPKHQCPPPILDKVYSQNNREEGFEPISRPGLSSVRLSFGFIATYSANRSTRSALEYFNLVEEKINNEVYVYNININFHIHPRKGSNEIYPRAPELTQTSNNRKSPITWGFCYK